MLEKKTRDVYKYEGAEWGRPLLCERRGVVLIYGH